MRYYSLIFDTLIEHETEVSPLNYCVLTFTGNFCFLNDRSHVKSICKLHFGIVQFHSEKLYDDGE